jgi:hypothetical protein
MAPKAFQFNRADSFPCGAKTGFPDWANMHVREFGTGCRGDSGDFGNQRAAAVGVNIGAGRVSCPHFPDTDQRL